MKKPPVKKKIGSLDTSFQYEGNPKVKGKTISRFSTMAGFGAHNDRMPAPRGSAKGPSKIKGKNRYG